VFYPIDPGLLQSRSDPSCLHTCRHEELPSAIFIIPVISDSFVITARFNPGALNLAMH